ncbi:MAG: hypothetical protein ABFD18_08090 [Syntrophomonas sp.]
MSNLHDVFVAILILVLSTGGLYFAYKTENLGKDKKYNRKL